MQYGINDPPFGTEVIYPTNYAEGTPVGGSPHFFARPGAGDHVRHAAEGLAVGAAVAVGTAAYTAWRNTGDRNNVRHATILASGVYALLLVPMGLAMFCGTIGLMSLLAPSLLTLVLFTITAVCILIIVAILRMYNRRLAPYIARPLPPERPH